MTVTVDRKPVAIDRVCLNDIQTLALAGGGNRCWWQGGALSRLLQAGWKLPAEMVGTSAGAAVGASFVTGNTAAALDACLRLYSGNAKVFDWRGLARCRLDFAHQHIYPAWIGSFLHADALTKAHASGTRLRVALTRPVRAIGLTGSIALGTLTYLIDRHFWNSIHPRLPQWLGLRQEFVDLRDCPSVAEARNLLSAAAAAPPFMSARRVGGELAIDGGYTDNAPIQTQSPEERSRTLVLLTRHDPKLPRLFRLNGRTYWQPGQRVPVSTWDCSPRTTVQAAYAMGDADAERALQTGLLQFR